MRRQTFLLPRLRLRYLLALVFLAALLLLGRQWLPALSGPPVRTVVVRLAPNAELSPAAIRRAVLPLIRHKRFLTIDLDSVRRRVESLPWVAAVEVRRVWPDALMVAATLRRPVARWGLHGLVDARGRVFGPVNSARFEGLPLLSGPMHSGPALWRDLVHARRLLGTKGFLVRELGQNDRGGIWLGLSGGLRLSLGRKQPFRRLERFVGIVVPTLGTALGRAASVDMRYPNGFAVGWKDRSGHGKKD